MSYFEIGIMRVKPCYENLIRVWRPVRSRDWLQMA